ncbi:Heme exporter protein D (CcmD) [Shimia sp. SK013]|uniref:heme exporter protein CcmD n=1 Tax=Shimia sp. SK013 TaxID=1389006 RepID=UPI0006CDEC64|nr:heme exporter protein CcmD [Shimia sp. SK013]KPA22304.1 Heme exporter protein D (CcmD) [Shimia sp. SK013]
MPELGKYAAEVLTAYGASIVLMTVLVLASIRAARKARKELEAAEARRDDR